MTSNAVPPSVTPPSPLEWPQDTIKVITSISKDSSTTVNSVGHSFTSADENVTSGVFKQVQGMIQINGLDAMILQVIDDDNFTVNVNSTNFYTYVSGGIFMVVTGLPPKQQQGFQVFNRPFQNIANQN